MNEKETIKILATIAASYPSVERLNETAVQGMAKVWARMFKDDDARLVGLAVGEHIATSKFPPSVAEIRERLVLMQRPDILTPEDAWTAVRELMIADGEFGGGQNIHLLPPLARSAVEQVGWSRLFDKRSESRALFLSAYQPLYKRERDRAMLPPSLVSDSDRVRQSNGSSVYAQLAQIQQLCEEKKQQARRLICDDSDSIAESGTPLLDAGNE